MLSVDRNIPIFIHICSKMGLKDPFLNRDEYENANPIWEDCDEYRRVEDVTWFKFVENEGRERVNVSFRDCYTFAFRSDNVQFFKEMSKFENRYSWLNKNDTIKVQTNKAESVLYGQWLSSEGWFNKSIVKCSVCGNTLNMDGVNAGRGDANFCPNCGARMNGGVENDR